MNIVVFGAAGWTGRAVLANLHGRHRVRAAVRSPKSWAKWSDVDGEWADGEILYGDISDFHAVHRATEGMDAAKVLELAIEKKVAFVPGFAFHPTGGGENTMRINFSYSSPEIIREGIARLGMVLKEEIYKKK